MLAHAHGFDPTWLEFSAIVLILGIFLCCWFAADRLADDDVIWVSREMPELHPDDDSTADWHPDDEHAWTTRKAPRPGQE